jgi:membrane complex biogenesis BtpA family protein
MSDWVKEIIGTDKAIIGLCHIPALPGDPFYDEEGGMEKVYDAVRRDVLSLQEGGIDAIQFTNEFSMPYSSRVGPAIVAAMAYLIGRVKTDLEVPFGANCIMDPLATIALCAATGAKWTRGAYHGTWATNSGLASADSSEVYRLRRNLGADNLKLVHYINPENSVDVGGRNYIECFKPYYFLNKPDAIGVAGSVAGQQPDPAFLRNCRETFRESVIVVITGVKLENLEELMQHANAAFVGTSLKKDGVFTNEVDAARVAALMEKVRSIR